MFIEILKGVLIGYAIVLAIPLIARYFLYKRRLEIREAAIWTALCWLVSYLIIFAFAREFVGNTLTFIVIALLCYTIMRTPDRRIDDSN
jgi:hypothetical protein